MELAFSTLGCPDWSLERAAEAAASLGYAGIELRALGGEIDLAGRPELSPGRIAAARAAVESRGVRVVCVDSSASFHEAEPGRRAAAVAAVVRHAEIARGLGAPLVRVFPNEVPAGEERGAVARRIAGGLAEAARAAGPGVVVALETHGDFAAADDAAALVEAAGAPGLGVVWDVANTTAAGDAPLAAARRLAGRLVLVHARDARPVAGSRFWRPVLAGRGEVDLAGAARALADVGYRGVVSFEWEKYWHRDLEEPEVALADFAAAWRRSV